jgi:DeoR family transcriptional regulator, aga operon transcriptional repressor
MTITERHQYIIQKLQEDGRVDIIELSDEMQVSGVTIRKDLKQLEERNLLFRTRGGGSITNPYAFEKPIDEKQFINAEQKKKIGKAALNMVEKTDSLILGSGTTIFELARVLYPQKRLFVITPALKIALELYNRPNVEVLQIGGVIHQSSASSAGPFAELILAHISCDLLFLGADGIDLDFGISITNINESSLNNKLINIAQKVVILADSTKFGKRGVGKICNLDQIHYIITDSDVPDTTVKLFEERGIQIIITDK